MATEGATIQIGDDIIQPIVQAKIQAAIVEALGGSGALIEHAVNAVLLDRRNSNGHPCKKGEYGDQGTALEKISREVITGATKDALKTYFAERKPELVKIIKQQMKKHEPLLVEAYFAGLIGAADNYRLSLSFNINKLER